MFNGNFIRQGYSDSKSLLSVPGLSGTSPAFKSKLIEVANKLGINPNYLATCISFETGGSFSPSEKNRAGSGAIGLIQFLPSTARNIGTTTEQLAQMSAEQQLDYVEKYLQPYIGRLKSLNDVYLAILNPANIGQKDDHILFSAPSKAYNQNKGFDKENKGYVTVKDVSKNINERYQAANNQLISVDAPAQQNGEKLPNYDLLIKELFATGPIETLVRKAILKKTLPSSKFSIDLNSNNVVDKIEFANILCTALRKQLNANTYICKLDDKVQVDCEVVGSSEIVKGAIYEIYKNISNESNILVEASINSKKQSTLPLITISELEINDRLFKFSMVK